VYFAPSHVPNGSMAEFAIVHAARTFPIPEALSDADALGIGIAGSTAWLATTWKGNLQPGESVLVLGAIGSVGQIAVQRARLAGAGPVVAAGRNAAVLNSLPIRRTRLRNRLASDVASRAAHSVLTDA
jgi:NADPH2:quinone reductase